MFNFGQPMELGKLREIADLLKEYGYIVGPETQFLLAGLPADQREAKVREEKSRLE